MATLKDVAALAGVSAATVSLYLNGKAAGRVSAQKQKEIEDAIRQLSYEPNAASKQLRGLGQKKPFYTIAVYWASDTRSALLGKVLSGIQESILEKGSLNIHVVFCPFVPNELFKEKGLIEPNLFNYDAAIIANTTLMDMQYLNSITPAIPVILLNRYLQQYNSVTVDNKKMGADLADLVADHGHTSVAVFRTQTPYLAMDDRVSGFIGRCRERGIEMPNHALFYTDGTIEGGMQTASDFLKLSEYPDVVFCEMDSIALGVLYQFHKSGIRIPEDISVISVGLNHSSVTKCCIPPLTVSEVPLTQIAKVCMDVATEKLTSDNISNEPAHIQLSTRIILRESLK